MGRANGGDASTGAKAHDLPGRRACHSDRYPVPTTLAIDDTGDWIQSNLLGASLLAAILSAVKRTGRVELKAEVRNLALARCGTSLTRRRVHTDQAVWPAWDELRRGRRIVDLVQAVAEALKPLRGAESPRGPLRLRLEIVRKQYATALSAAGLHRRAVAGLLPSYQHGLPQRGFKTAVYGVVDDYLRLRAGQAERWSSWLPIVLRALEDANSDELRDLYSREAHHAQRLAHPAARRRAAQQKARLRRRVRASRPPSRGPITGLDAVRALDDALKRRLPKQSAGRTKRVRRSG